MLHSTAPHRLWAPSLRRAAPPPLLVLVLLLALAPQFAPAHRPLLLGQSGGAQHSTWEGALLVPWATSSWSAKRVAEVGTILGGAPRREPF
jgi:hypothetical protein